MIGAASLSPPKKQKKGLSRILPSLLAPLRRLTGSSFAKAVTKSGLKPPTQVAATPPDSPSSLDIGVRQRQFLSPGAETSSWTLASSSSSDPTDAVGAKIHIRDRVSQFGMHMLGCEQLQGRMPAKLHAQYAHFIRHGGDLGMTVADAVAHAVRLWADELGASHYAHWVHPFTRSTSATATSQTAFSSCDPLDTSEALDASLLPHGSLRSPTQAAGYTVWDLRSPMVIVNNVVLIPSVLVSHMGDALDEKLPLIRAEQMVSERGGLVQVGCQIRYRMEDVDNRLQHVVQQVLSTLARVGVLVARHEVDKHFVSFELSPLSPARALDHCDLVMDMFERTAANVKLHASFHTMACRWTVSHADLDTQAALLVPLLSIDRSRYVISAAMELCTHASSYESLPGYWANLENHLTQILTNEQPTNVTGARTWISLPPIPSRHFPTLIVCALTSAAASLLTHPCTASLSSRESAASYRTLATAPSFIASSTVSCIATLTESPLLAPHVLSVRELHAFVHASMSWVAVDSLDTVRARVAEVQGTVVPKAVAYRKKLADSITSVLATGVCEQEDVQMERETLEVVTVASHALAGVCEKLVMELNKHDVDGIRERVEEAWFAFAKDGKVRRLREQVEILANELEYAMPK